MLDLLEDVVPELSICFMLLVAFKLVQFLYIFVWVAAPNVDVTFFDETTDDGEDGDCTDVDLEAAVTILPSFSTKIADVLPILSRSLAQSFAFNTTLGDGRLELAFCGTVFLQFLSTLVLMLDFFVISTEDVENHQRMLSAMGHHSVVLWRKQQNYNNNCKCFISSGDMQHRLGLAGEPRCQFKIKIMTIIISVYWVGVC